MCNGQEGSPWTDTGKLPSGAQETGTWAFTRSVEKITTEVEGTKEEITVGDSGKIIIPISFPIPLAGALQAEKVHISTEGNFATFCEGSAAAPEAINSGELCVFFNTSDPAPVETTLIGVCKTASAVASCNQTRGASPTGALMVFSEPTGDAYASGTFAVKG